MNRPADQKQGECKQRQRKQDVKRTWKQVDHAEPFVDIQRRYDEQEHQQTVEGGSDGREHIADASASGCRPIQKVNPFGFNGHDRQLERLSAAMSLQMAIPFCIFNLIRVPRQICILFDPPKKQAHHILFLVAPILAARARSRILPIIIKLRSNICLDYSSGVANSFYVEEFYSPQEIILARSVRMSSPGIL